MAHAPFGEQVAYAPFGEQVAHAPFGEQVAHAPFSEQVLYTFFGVGGGLYSSFRCTQSSKPLNRAFGSVQSFE